MALNSVLIGGMFGGTSMVHRKLTRFFVINPRPDRRIESRFSAKSDVVVKTGEGPADKVYKAVAFEIGQFGMRLELAEKLNPGLPIQIAFPNTLDNVRCFGRVVWSQVSKAGPGNECGVSVESWYGITDGPGSWKKFANPNPKKDRRIIKR
jgi:hypothetical protein